MEVDRTVGPDRRAEVPQVAHNARLKCLQDSVAVRQDEGSGLRGLRDRVGGMTEEHDPLGVSSFQSYYVEQLGTCQEELKAALREISELLAKYPETLRQTPVHQATVALQRAVELQHIIFQTQLAIIAGKVNEIWETLEERARWRAPELTDAMRRELLARLDDRDWDLRVEERNERSRREAA